MANPQFIKSGMTTLTFSKGEFFPSTRPIQPQQIRGIAQSGKVKVAELGPDVQLHVLRFERLPEDDFTALLNWFQSNTIRWSLNTFTYRDPNGVNHTVRYWGDRQEFEMPQVAAGLYNVTIVLREEL